MSSWTCAQAVPRLAFMRSFNLKFSEAFPYFIEIKVLEHKADKILAVMRCTGCQPMQICLWWPPCHRSSANTLPRACTAELKLPRKVSSTVSVKDDNQEFPIGYFSHSITLFHPLMFKYFLLLYSVISCQLYFDVDKNQLFCFVQYRLIWTKYWFICWKSLCTTLDSAEHIK